MKDIKKLMITLVALIALTTGAWAQPWTSGACTVTFSDGVLTVSGTGAMADYTSNSAPWSDSDIKTIVIESGVTSIGEGAFASCYNLESVSIPASVTSIGARAFEYCGLATTAPTVSFAEGSTPLTIGERAFYYANLKSIDIPNRVTSIGEQAFSGCSSMESVSIPASVTSIREEAFWNCGMLAKVYIFAPSLTTYGDLAFDDNADGRKIHVLSDAVDTYKAGWPDYAADFVGDLQPLASGPKVAWDKAENSGTFKMPGGNVTLEPEYYPQATAAEGAVTAATDAKATTDAPLVTIDETKLTGATKMMYYVSTDATAPAYDAEGWTDVLPTAEKFTEAANLNVWYYPVGTDEGVGEATATYSDGDMNAKALAVTLGAAPLWNAEFDLTNAPEEDKAGKWSTDIPEGGVVKGTEVKVNYTGTKKVIGVKAEKKAAAPAYRLLSAATAEDVGKIAGADGNIYDTKAAAEAAGTTAVAMIAYVGTASDCAHGLAIALADESGTKEYGAAGTACSGKAAVTGGTWRLPSIKDWQYMFIGCGASGSYSGNPNEMSYSGLASKLTTAQGDALQTVEYWSSTENSPGSTAWIVKFDGSNASFNYKPEFFTYRVRACLAF